MTSIVLLGKCSRMVDHDLHVHGVSVSTELEDVPQIMADATQLQQVILNLIKNAIEALAAGPSRRKSYPTGDDPMTAIRSSRFTVQDTGPGITPKNEANIFDPFFTTKSSGMGLGLSISRRIIEDHGGDLRLARQVQKAVLLKSLCQAQQRAVAGASGRQSLHE